MLKEIIKTKIIETERMFLRELNPRVYEMAFDTLDDKGLMEFFGLTTEEELLLERRKFNEGMTSFNKSFLNFQLIDKNTSEIIGSCGFHTWFLVHFRAEIGYFIHEKFRNKGLMKEAVCAVITYGFEKMELQRIEACLSFQNIPSLKLVEYFGFKNEGLMRKHYFKDNKLEDSAIFALLREEFEEMKASGKFTQE